MKTFAVLVLALAGCASDKPCDPDAPNTICTIAGHTRDGGYKGDEDLATKADMDLTMDSAVDPDGNVWFIDFNNYVIRKIDADGIVHRMVGIPRAVGDSPATEGLPAIAALDTTNNHTPSMVFHDGYLYLASWHESRIKRVRLSDMMMEIVVGRGVRTHYDGDGGPAINAGVDLPSSITFDAQNNLVFMDQGNLVVRQVDSTGTIHTIAGRCVIEAADCAGTLQACPGSNKFVCGSLSACDDAGGPSTALCTQTTGGDGGPASLARFNLPFTQAADPAGRIAYDHAGNLIIAETANNAIRKVDPSGMITTVAGTGEAGYSGDGGPATAAQINHPVDIAIADDNTIYFTDVFNHCVRKIDPSGIISGAAGACRFTPEGEPGAFSGDGGPPLKAKMYKPYGINLVGNKLYVSDAYNNRLRVVNLP